MELLTNVPAQCDEQQLASASSPSLEIEASTTSVISVTQHADATGTAETARYVRFRKVQLLCSKPSELIKNGAEVGRILQQCNTQAPIEAPLIDLVVPLDSDDCIRMIDGTTGATLYQFTLSDIACCAKGTVEQTNHSVFLTHQDHQHRPCATDRPPSVHEMNGVVPISTANVDSDTSALTPADLNSSDTSSVQMVTDTSKTTYRTHVIRCGTIYEATRLLSFASKHLSSRRGKVVNPMSLDHGTISLRLLLDIREEDKSSENEWKPVPKEKSEVFKLRAKTEKRLLIGVHQISGLPQIAVEHCLDVSVAYGRYICDSEYTSLGAGLKELSGEASSSVVSGSSYSTYVSWPCQNPDFHMFDDVTGKDECLFFTVNVRLALSNVEKPICLQRICRARIYRPDETFWLVTDRRPVSQDFHIQMSEFVDEEGTLFIGRFIEAVNVDPSPSLSSSQPQTSEDTQSSAGLLTELADDEDDDRNEPLMSGHGVVSKEVTDDQLLADWGHLISDWHAKVKQHQNAHAPDCKTREEQLLSGTIGPGISDLGNSLVQRIRRLVARGVPDALRAEVWQLLAACPSGETALMDAYRILITKPCKHDAVIQRDLARTFPAHSFFRQSVGQEYLFQVSRAYALYDEDVGYCQGLSFFAAVLLLHMPVEQAFTLLVQVNNHYGLRELFLTDFEGLHMRLHQLNRIIQDQLPDVAKHFEELGLETHMYASQWFLTLFTAKFPLPVVFHIVDLFLAEGMIFIVKVAYTVLRIARRDLLGLDFEGVLKYLRVTLPKRFISSEAGEELINLAMNAKVTASKMVKYAKEWLANRAHEKLSESPIQALERQLTMLRDQVSRLERENEALASGLITSKTTLHREVDKLEDKAEILTRELFISRQDLQDTLEEKNHLESEVAQVKQMLRATLDQIAQERLQQQSLIAAYRAVASDLSKSQYHERCNSTGSGPPAAGEISDVNTKSSEVPASQYPSPDAIALHLRLLWSLVEQVTRCNRCGAVLTDIVNEWRKNASDVGESDSVINKLVNEYMKDNVTQPWIAENGEPVQMVTIASSDAVPHRLRTATTQTDSIPGLSTPSTATKSRHWIANTLNSLRTIGSADLISTVMTGNTDDAVRGKSKPTAVSVKSTGDEQRENVPLA